MSLSLSASLEPINYYKNNERVNKTKKIQDYLGKIKLQPNTCLTNNPNDENSYLLGKSILLGKQIGSKSKYGVVYKCKNINPKIKNIPLFTAKIQLNTNALNREINILNELSIYGIKNKIPHLPILFKIVKCPYNSNFKLFDTVNKNVIEKGYTIILNELASGDLNYFLNKKYALNLNERIWRNMYEQVFISLLILHSQGISHNDSHSGNFLYHKINKGGCFHYKINEIDYYIENLGFIWTSWDYGKISKLENKGSYVYDYMLVNLVTRKNNMLKKNNKYKTHEWYGKYEWGYLNQHVNIPEKIQKFQNLLWKLLGDYNNKNDLYMLKTRKMTEDLFFKFFLDNGLLFSKNPIGKIISSINITIN